MSSHTSPLAGCSPSDAPCWQTAADLVDEEPLTASQGYAQGSLLGESSWGTAEAHPPRCASGSTPPPAAGFWTSLLPWLTATQQKTKSVPTSHRCILPFSKCAPVEVNSKYISQSSNKQEKNTQHPPIWVQFCTRVTITDNSNSYVFMPIAICFFLIWTFRFPQKNMHLWNNPWNSLEINSDLWKIMSWKGIIFPD